MRPTKLHLPAQQQRFKLPLVMLFALTFSGLSGCSNLGVKPHQRGLLAKDSMLLTTDAVEGYTGGIAMWIATRGQKPEKRAR